MYGLQDGRPRFDRTQPVLPPLPGTPERRSHGYVRHVTIDLFAALTLTTGIVTNQLTARHRVTKSKKFLQLIEKTVLPELTVHVVLDDSSTHKTPQHPTLAAPDEYPVEGADEQGG